MRMDRPPNQPRRKNKLQPITNRLDRWPTSRHIHCRRQWHRRRHHHLSTQGLKMPKILYLLRIFLYCTFLLHISPLLATIQPRCIFEQPTGEIGICITAPVTINNNDNPCVAKANPIDIPQMDIITYCDTNCTKVVKCEYQCAGTMLGSTGYDIQY